MTLAGSVLLLVSTWSRAQTDAFFSDNGIKLTRVLELSFVQNGFFV